MNNNFDRLNNLLKILFRIEKDRAGLSVDFPVDFYYHHQMERIFFSLHSVNTLIKVSIEKNDHAIGLIYRNIISDFITCSFITLHSDDDAEIRYKINWLYYYDLQLIEKAFKFLQGNHHYSKESVKSLSELYNDNDHAYAHIMEYSKKNDISKPFPSTFEMVKRLTDTSIPGLKKYFLEAYDVWLYLSKFEHIGISSYGTTRAVDSISLWERLKLIIDVSKFTCLMCLEKLKREKEFQELEKL